MVIDDMADRKRDADIILNTTPGISAEEYEGLAVTESEILSGPNYALVDDKFARARARSLERRTDSRPEQIYINYGLSDPVNATSAALFALETLTRKLKLDVVIGPACPFAADIADKATSLGATACSGASIDDIVERMADADLALGAAGTTSWERCCLGLPTVVSIIADNQKPNANALANAEAASVLPEELSLDSDAMAKAVERHLIDQPFHGQMARNAATLCDGLGARRVAMALTPALTRDGSRISLRPALHADGERMLKWQLDPVTRAHARNPEPPTRDEHFRWLDAKLGDPDCLFNIVTLDGVPAGVVRLDQFAPEEYEVTIFVAPDKHGKGIAKRAVTLAHRLVPWATIHAYVLPENIASHALFKSAGYAYRGDHYVSAPLRAAA